MDLGVSGPTAPLLNPVDQALDQLSVGLDHLVKLVEDGGLDHYDDHGLVGFLQGFERVRNRLSLVDHVSIAAVEGRDLPQTLCQGSVRRVLTSALRISKAEAARRVRASDAVGPRVSMLGEPLIAVRPYLAVAQRDGELSTEQVAIVERALTPVDRRGFDPADIDAGEQLLVRHARSFGPEDLKQLADRVLDAIDPDGTLPKDELNHDRRFVHLRPTRDGAWTGEFRLTGVAGAKLKALLDPLATPGSARQIKPSRSRKGRRSSPPARCTTSTPATTGNGCTTPSKNCATGCSVPGTPCRPVGYRPPSSSPSTSTIC